MSSENSELERWLLGSTVSFSVVSMAVEGFDKPSGPTARGSTTSDTLRAMFQYYTLRNEIRFLARQTQFFVQSGGRKIFFRSRFR